MAENMEEVFQNIEHTQLNKDEIIKRLREKGFRITEQRKLIVDIISSENFTCSKEVYILAHRRDPDIGIATVYRMINVLEEIGAITRKLIQRVNCQGRCCNVNDGCTVITENSAEVMLSSEDMQEAIKYIMQKKGYSDVNQIKDIFVNTQNT